MLKSGEFFIRSAGAGTCVPAAARYRIELVAAKE
jgi:hypothetical protein